MHFALTCGRKWYSEVLVIFTDVDSFVSVLLKLYDRQTDTQTENN
jgi:hypothetical protein